MDYYKKYLKYKEKYSLLNNQIAGKGIYERDVPWYGGLYNGKVKKVPGQPSIPHDMNSDGMLKIRHYTFTGKFIDGRFDETTYFNGKNKVIQFADMLEMIQREGEIKENINRFIQKISLKVQFIEYILGFIGMNPENWTSYTRALATEEQAREEIRQWNAELYHQNLSLAYYLLDDIKIYFPEITPSQMANFWYLVMLLEDRQIPKEKYIQIADEYRNLQRYQNISYIEYQQLTERYVRNTLCF